MGGKAPGEKWIGGVTLAHLRALWLALLLACPAAVLWPAPVARGAYISEVFFDDGRDGPDTMPNAIEFDRLDRAPGEQVELIVIDAGSDSFGEIMRIVPIPTNEATFLVAEHPWPHELWGREHPLGDNHAALEELLEGATSFRFGRARSLMLYDQPTGLSEWSLESIFSDANQARLADVALLDALTFVFDADAAEAEAPGPHFEVQPDHAITWPLATVGLPAAERLAGEITATGKLAGTNPPLALTPGLENPIWSPIPEPGAAVVMLAGLAGLLMGRPPRRCSSARLRL